MATKFGVEVDRALQEARKAETKDMEAAGSRIDARVRFVLVGRMQRLNVIMFRGPRQGAGNAKESQGSDAAMNTARAKGSADETRFASVCLAAKPC